MRINKMIKGKSFDSPVYYKIMYGGQSGEFVCGCWGSKG